MTHPTREEWMSYLYDELSADAKPALQRHLETCPECRGVVETWTRTGQRLDDWTLPKHRPRRRFAVPVLKWAAAAAVLAVAAAGATRLLALNHEVTQLRAELDGRLVQEVEAAVQMKLAQQMQEKLDAAIVQLAAASGKAAGTEAQALLAEFAEAYEEKRLQDQQTLLAALRQLQTRSAADYAKLRKELETVAVFAEAEFQRAQNQIASIAYPQKPTNNEP